MAGRRATAKAKSLRSGLYDTFLDPVERVNLVDSGAHAGVLADMRARLDRWMRDS